MLVKPPTVPANHANAPSYEDLVQTLQLIVHATAPAPDDGGGHENAYALAMDALKRIEARKEYEAQQRAFDTLPDDYECPH